MLETSGSLIAMSKIGHSRLKERRLERLNQRKEDTNRRVFLVECYLEILSYHK